MWYMASVEAAVSISNASGSGAHSTTALGLKPQCSELQVQSGQIQLLSSKLT